MCGIFCVVGAQRAAVEIVEGLRRLEYRGYDSAGLATVAQGRLRLLRAVGPVDALAALPLPPGRVGIGHTRWATHGAPSERNAHPHPDCRGRLAVVHNGIIENHQTLREKLTANGHVFASDTDTETIAHLVEQRFEGDLVAAVRAAVRQLEGSFALAVVSADAPDRVVAVRSRSPLIVGLAEGRTILASDTNAILPLTRRVVFVGEGELVEARAGSLMLYGPDGEPREPELTQLRAGAQSAQKDGYDHYMLKEIHEIPAALRALLHGRIGLLGQRFDVEGGLREEEIRGAPRLTVVACGTSYYAGAVGKSIVERLSGVPVDVQLASEFRYAPYLGAPGALALFVSQSGETADTLEALRATRAKGGRTLAIVNVERSSLALEADGVFHLRAGPEIGVASTKAFVNTLGAFYLLGAHLGSARGRLSGQEAEALAAGLADLPALTARTLARADEIRAVGESFFHGAADAFFLGRQMAHPLAMEGALKLKEISYVHAEGCAAGELKHGPLALLAAGLPVTALLAPDDPTHAVMLSNILEVKARGAKVLGILSDADHAAARVVDAQVRLPPSGSLWYPVPACVALYLLAYQAARARGCSIDKPRNLAKSVTVE